MTKATRPKKTLKDVFNEGKLATLTSKLETAMVETYQPLLDFALEITGNKGMDVELSAEVELTYHEEEGQKLSVSHNATLELKFSPEVTDDIYEQGMRHAVQTVFAKALEK